MGGLTPAELATIGGRLEAFADDLFASLPRADQRARGQCYLRGLMLDGRRKSIEPMAARLGEVHYQPLDQPLGLAAGPRAAGRAAGRRAFADRVGGGRHRLSQGRLVLGGGAAPVFGHAGQDRQLPAGGVGQRGHRARLLPTGLATVPPRPLGRGCDGRPRAPTSARTAATQANTPNKCATPSRRTRAGTAVPSRATTRRRPHSRSWPWRPDSAPAWSLSGGVAARACNAAASWRCGCARPGSPHAGWPASTAASCRCAGCWSNGPRASPSRPSTGWPTCPRPPRWWNWSVWPGRAGEWNRTTANSKAPSGWTTSKAAAGPAGTTTSRWSRSRTASSPWSGCNTQNRWRRPDPVAAARAAAGAARLLGRRLSAVPASRTTVATPNGTTTSANLTEPY